MRNKGWEDKNREGGGEEVEGSIVFRIKLQLVFFLPSILSEKQPLSFGYGLERVVEEFRHGNSFGYMVNGEGERDRCYIVPELNWRMKFGNLNTN